MKTRAPGAEAPRVGDYALMTCGGHRIEFRCCGVVHYRSVAPIIVGERIRAENLRRVCLGCAEPADRLSVTCCICGFSPTRPWELIA